MKLAKLSLAAIMVAGLTTSSFAADTLSEAFAKGTVNGQLQAYYFDKKDGASDSADLFSTGLDISYETAKFYGFAFKATFQGSSSPWADQAGKDMFMDDEYGSGAVLSEVYLSYTMKNTKAMVGRMYLDTPLVASSGSRITKEAFQGAAIINTDLPNTTLIAGYVNKFQSRTNGDGKIGQFERLDDDKSDAYTLAVINKSVSGLTLTAAYLNHIDNLQVAYVEALYHGKVNSDFGYTLGGQYYYNKFDDSVVVGSDDKISAYGFKAGLDYKGLNATVAYSKTADKDIDALVPGLGNGVDFLYTNAVINSPGYEADAKSYMVDLNYDITKAANVGARYTYVKIDDFKESFTSVYASYKFDGPVKGLSVSAEYEDQGKDIDGHDFWLKANYQF